MLDPSALLPRRRVPLEVPEGATRSNARCDETLSPAVALLTLTFALSIGWGCAVDTSAIQLDGSAGPGCAIDSDCDDEVDCTDDECIRGRCLSTSRNTACPLGQVCRSETGCQPVANCDGLECQESLRNDTRCQVGRCQAEPMEGICLAESACAANELCCGDGSCQDCDDDNPCTRDSCDETGCVNEPLTGDACDDGVFCTGTETCNAGSCESSGNPCVGEDSICDRALDRCVGCSNRSDCPDRIVPQFPNCDGHYPTLCSERTVVTRRVTDFNCVDNECVEAVDTESLDCTRETDNQGCGSAMNGVWSACGGFSDVCDNTGSRTRDVTTYACANGSCTPTTTQESGSCPRDTNGTSCGCMTFGTWSACGGFTEPCGQTGMRSRAVMTPTCNGGSCGSVMTTQTETCTRNTNGTMCDQEVDTGACVLHDRGNPCETQGTREVTTTTTRCGSGTCSDVMVSVETESCSENRDGDSCVRFTCQAGTCMGNQCEDVTDTCEEERDCGGCPASKECVCIISSSDGACGCD